MTDFEREWYTRYMTNTATLDTLQLLVKAGRLSQSAIDGWVAERQKRYGA